MRLSGAKDMEARQLLSLYQEIRDGNFGFWSALMWAARADKLTAKERLTMDRIIDRIKNKAFLDCPG